MQPTDRPTWIRWHKLAPDLVTAILEDNATVYLALHPYDNSLAVLTVPAADRFQPTPKATARIRTKTVTMTVVYQRPQCPTRGPS